MIRLLIWLLPLSTLLGSALSAQNRSGVVVTGPVLDPYQAAVLGAKVTLKRRMTGPSSYPNTAMWHGEQTQFLM